jgi:hypothetical protein
MRFVSDAEIATLTPAEQRDSGSPIPTQPVSNGEFTPLPQSEDQRRVEARIGSLADELAPRHGLSRRGFLSSAAGMSAAFLAMNEVFGPVFTASRAEAATPGMADARAAALRKQFIVDCQTHFVRDDYEQKLLVFSADFAKKNWNPDISGADGLTRYKFQNYVKEIFIDSDTKVAMISGTPTDDYAYLFLTNDQIASARDVVNKVAGSRRCLGHGIVTPGTPGWFEEITRVMDQLKPDSIKGYTIGDPIYQTKKKTNWRMDDEKLVYPLYEAMLKRGINTICIHKGLMPADYMTSWADMWQYATVWDVGKAAKDWPQINFVIYHSAMRPFLELPDRELAQFEKTGALRLGLRSRRHPGEVRRQQRLRRTRRLLRQHLRDASEAGRGAHGTLIKGLGEDKVIWGTDSVWWGSPQWQIEAMRRLEIPEDMQKKYGYKPLGAAEGPVKTRSSRAMPQSFTRSIRPRRRRCRRTTSTPSGASISRKAACPVT